MDGVSEMYLDLDHDGIFLTTEGTDGIQKASQFFSNICALCEICD